MNKKTLALPLVSAILGFSSFLYLGCASNPPAPTGDPRWQVCVQDTDCMELRGHCNSPHTVHKKYEDAFRKFKRASEKQLDCAKVSVETWPENYQVSCTENQCQILELEKDLRDEGTDSADY